MLARSVIAIVSGVIALSALMGGSTSASPSDPTFRFEWCKRAVGKQGPEIDKIEPDDFIAVCVGRGDPRSETFVKTWRTAVETCIQGNVPVTQSSAHAKAFLYIKGRTVEAVADCDKVFDIATKFGIISKEEAVNARISKNEQAKKGQEFWKRLTSEAADGVWQAKFLLAVKYLDLEPSSASFSGKYSDGLTMIEQLAASGHGDKVLQYLAPIEERANNLNNDAMLLIKIHEIHKRLASGGHAPSSLKLCNKAVNQAVRLFENPNPHPHELSFEIDYLNEVSSECNGAITTGGDPVKAAVQNLRQKVVVARDGRYRRNFAVKQQQDQAVIKLIEVLGAAISAPSSSDGPLQDVMVEQRRLNSEQCRQMQLMTLESGDKTMIGASHLVIC